MEPPPFFQLTHHAYMCFWITLLLFCLVLALYLFASASVYFFLCTNEMQYYAELLVPSGHEFQVVGILFGLIGLLFVGQALHMCYLSIRHGALTLIPHEKPPSKPKEIVPAPTTEASPSRWSACTARMTKWTHKFLKFIEPLLEYQFIASKLIEVLAQTFQAYRSSQQIEKRWINNLYVGFLVANSWSTAIVQYSHPSVVRITYTLSDAIFTFGASVMIPLLVFVPYTADFDWGKYGFIMERLYDDVWFTNMILENQQMFAVTKLDILTKLIPQLTLFACVQSLKTLVRRRTTDETNREHKVIAVVAPTEDTRPSTKVEPEVESKKIKKSPKTTAFGARGLITLFFLVWGALVLSVHVVTDHISTSVAVDSCQLTLKPWFMTKKCYCTVVNFNCHRHNRIATAVDHDFELLHDETLRILIFSHCPGLHVPRSIRRFPNLIGLEVFNSTIVEWTKEASISADHHPKLAYLTMTLSNMSALPPGVLQPFPESLIDLELIQTNLTTLPDTIVEPWKELNVLFVEHHAMTEIPPAVYHLSKLDTVSFTGNQFTNISSLELASTTLFSLQLGSNPIEVLPDHMTPTFTFLCLENTSIHSLPPWIETPPPTAERILMKNTPFCDALSEEVIEAQYSMEDVVKCVKTNCAKGRYPLAYMKTIRAPE